MSKTITVETEEELKAALDKYRRLDRPSGDYLRITINGNYEYVSNGVPEPPYLTSWVGAQFTIPDDIHENHTEEHTGGSSSYYDVTINGQTISCLDIIEALGMDFALGNIFKAAWRIAAGRNGKKKKGNNEKYDAEKIVFFGERIKKPL